MRSRIADFLYGTGSGNGSDDCRSGASLPAAAGIGLKPEHFRQVLEERPAIRFFEVHAENYMGAGGPFHHYLTRIREAHPLSLHGVGLSLGGEEPLDTAHLGRLAVLVDRYQPASFSEHLAWCGHAGVFLNDLLPIPYDKPTLQRVCSHVTQVQEHLGLRMLLENPSTYLEHAHSTRSEADFLGEVVRRTGCGLLLDVNNAHVSAVNGGRQAMDFIEALPLQAVGEIHLSGHARDLDAAGAPLLIDDHGSAVDPVVWDLFRRVLRRTGPVPVLIEWDNEIPPLPELLSQARQAQRDLDRMAQPCHSSWGCS